MAETIRNMIANYQTTYIPGHAGIWYNATADLMSGAAEPICHIQLHPSDVRNRKGEIVRANPPPRKTWWFFSGMESLDIKFGYGASQETRGGKTRINTKKILGTISQLTLNEILRAG